jgi:hypothetical protein
MHLIALLLFSKANHFFIKHYLSFYFLEKKICSHFGSRFSDYELRRKDEMAGTIPQFFSTLLVHPLCYKNIGIPATPVIAVTCKNQVAPIRAKHGEGIKRFVKGNLL